MIMNNGSFRETEESESPSCYLKEGKDWKEGTPLTSKSFVIVSTLNPHSLEQFCEEFDITHGGLSIGPSVSIFYPILLFLEQRC